MSASLVMKNWTEYSPGTAKKKEDGNGTYGSFFFVIDAFSEPHSEKYPQRLLNGLTLGEHTARFAESFLGLNLYLLGKEPIWTLFSELNKAVLSEKVHGGIPLDVTGLSGASFTAANIKERHTEIIAAGDSFAAAELKNGEILMTKNQVHLHDMAMHKEIARLIEEVAFDWGLRLDSVGKETLEETREEMWNRFVPILTKARKKVMNNPGVPEGYPTLNGDNRSANMWQRYLLLTAEIKRILLFTDGFIAWEILKQLTSRQLGTFIIEFYKKAGIDGILSFTRSIESATSQRNYISHAEATVTAIELY